jgi:hypothetical protein
LEHSIRTWVKANDSWDVTHHKENGGDGYLHDVEKDFKNFPTRILAEQYAFRLFKRLYFKGNHVKLESPESFGKETETGGCWGSFSGDRWLIRLDEKGNLFFWSSPACADDKSKVPKWILAELETL